MDNKPTVITIFGASGDLAKLKLFPSIYNLYVNNLLPQDFRLVGFSRKEFSNEEFRESFRNSVQAAFGKDVDEVKLGQLLDAVYYHVGSYDNKADFDSLHEFVYQDGKSEKEICNINYLSVPPFVFRNIIDNLAQSRKDVEADIRLIIEKPFGEDEDTARNLFHFVNLKFDQKQIYLLDHYLGKLAVQSLLHLRRTNRILNSMLQGSEIANIQITAFEDVGVEERIGYFESVGIMKDFVHSHLLQILALVTMNIPTSKTGASLSREKYSVLSALSYDADQDSLVVGQYDSYCSHNGVPADSSTETFAAIKLGIDLEEWYRVPIYLRVGKKMERKETYVVIELEKYEFQKQYNVPMNRVVFKLFPDRKIEVKLYNQFLDGSMHELDLGGDLLCDNKDQICDEKYSLTEYATLIKDVMHADRLFFLEFQEVLASWKIMDQIIHHKNGGGVKLLKYSDNSAGPDDMGRLTRTEGFEWHEYSV